MDLELTIKEQTKLALELHTFLVSRGLGRVGDAIRVLSATKHAVLMAAARESEGGPERLLAVQELLRDNQRVERQVLVAALAKLPNEGHGQREDS